MNERFQVVVVLISSVASFAWFLIGCAAPLTPSEGPPKPVDVIVFYAVPLMINGVLFNSSKLSPVKIYLGASFLFILGIGAWVLSTSYR